MNVLYLGPDSKVSKFLKGVGESVTLTEDKIDLDYVSGGKFHFIVSYGYRHIISKDILDLFKLRAINLHIAFLPWNRGADPNLWSFIDDTPKGVTIHLLDEGIDTGNILYNKRVFFYAQETLRTSYEKLNSALQWLFVENWQEIKTGSNPGLPQMTIHKSKDKEPYLHLLKNGWDTPVSELENLDADTGGDVWK